MYGSSALYQMSPELACWVPTSDPPMANAFQPDWGSEGYLHSDMLARSFYCQLHGNAALQSSPWQGQSTFMPVAPPPGLAPHPALVPSMSLRTDVEADSEPDAMHSSACSTIDTETDPAFGSADVGILGSEELPTVGSLNHRSGTCKPCAFVFKDGPGCTSGVECTFCHLCEPGEKKRRVKSRKWQHQQSKVKSRCPCDSICMPWLHVETKSF
eukprot:TRINITY_DN1001_c0_g1_i2.p1 TRINITY_DN1001_c0_g1~~TRINITY_DN1001_c0_g1_i2.p1  ORF type:complete len:213 (+),score=30.88 TRINITY_DN1001_c0_g1_i2:66-704(+)